MPLLALDTSTGACSVALFDGGRGYLAARHELMPRGHAEALAPMVAAVMDEAGLEMSAVKRLGVTTGPGTFTGVRIGIAFARALAVALDVPLTGITTLRAIAANLEGGPQPVAAIMDARRGEVYMQLFGPRGEQITPPQILGLAEAAQSLPRKALQLTGSGAELVYDAAGVSASDWQIPPASPYPDARKIAALCRKIPVTPIRPGPLYLRRPDAKLPRKPGLAALTAS